MNVELENVHICSMTSGGISRNIFGAQASEIKATRKRGNTALIKDWNQLRLSDIRTRDLPLPAANPQAPRREHSLDMPHGRSLTTLHNMDA